MPPKVFACWICGKEVDLKTCKTDEKGLAVHEACYAVRIALKLRTCAESTNNVRERIPARESKAA